MTDAPPGTFSVNEDEVNQIVETMKKKYREDGIQIDEVSTSFKELRGIIEEDTYSRIDIESQEDLNSFNSDIAKKLGAFYLKLKAYLKPIVETLKKLPLSEETGYYLYSANMKYSSNQYLALTSAVGFLTLLIMLVLGLIIGATTRDPVLIVLLPLLLGIIGFAGSIGVMLYIPRRNAVARGEACSSELPFALRHMSTELRAGVGLFKTLQTIAAADYGVLSEEMAQTINEIDEGTDTSIALKHLALRTQSRALKATINHMIRAMRVGGNLSEVMSDIAEDVSEEIKNKINAFSQQMNFFAVVFIFAGIVLPVAITILGSIRNSPVAQGESLFKAVPLTPEVLVIFYFVIMPIVFIGMNFIVKSMEPKM